MIRTKLSVLLIAAATLSWAGPETEATAAGQSIADALRDAAKTDFGFIAAGLMKTGNGEDLAGFVQYPADEIAIVKLTGKQIRSALERSVSLFPSPNPGFLQVSGLEITFSRSASIDSRITSVSANGAGLDPTRTYTVAMPGGLARGGLGYFTIWDKSAIDRTLSGVTLESVVKGKSASSRGLRWKVTD